MREVRCAEVGLFPDCEGVMRGETDEEVMEAVAQHGRDVHGMTDEDFTPDVVERVGAVIRPA